MVELTQSNKGLSMNLFIASDIHGCERATQLTLERFEQSGANHLILLGDLINHGPRNPVPAFYNPTKVAELLNQYKDSIIAVRGNCDSEVDQMLLEFPIMNDFNWLPLPSGQRVFLTHGHLYNKDKASVLKQGDIMVHGHTHLPQAQWEGDIIVVNPGSVTIPKGGHEASFATWKDGVIEVKTLASQQVIATLSI
jgi:putative phosphoesterase